MGQYLTGPGASVSVTSTKYFLTLDSPVIPSATIGADTFDIGWAADSVSPWYFLDTMNQDAPFGLGFNVDVDSGSPTYSVQHTYGRSAVFTHSTVTGETTAQEGASTTPIAAGFSMRI